MRTMNRKSWMLTLFLCCVLLGVAQVITALFAYFSGL